MIVGTIDEKLAKGLAKRRAREGQATIERARVEPVPPCLASGRKINRNKWFVAVMEFLLGKEDTAVDLIRTGAHRWEFLQMSAVPNKGFYRVGSFRIDAKKRRATCSGELKLGLSVHAVERYFERVRRPFTLSELPALLRLAFHQGFRDLPSLVLGHTVDVYTPDGLLVFEAVDVEGTTMLIAKTFLGKRELNDERYARWQEAQHE
jgi:hypothetical protein